MRLVTIVFERIPMVWLLLGLLFIAGGLYLGFDYKLTFVYLIVGAFCSLYGLLLFIFLRIERPRQAATSTLSPHFISAGETMSMPQVKQETVNQESEQKGTWQPAEGKPA